MTRRRSSKKDDDTIFTKGTIAVIICMTLTCAYYFTPEQMTRIFQILLPVLGIVLIASMIIYSRHMRLRRKEREERKTYMPSAPIPYNHSERNDFLSSTEKEFKKNLKQWLPENIEIHCKVRLADTLGIKSAQRLDVKKPEDLSILLMHADFVLLDATTQRIILVLELDGKSHESEDAKQRDTRKNNALKENKIPFKRLSDQQRNDPTILKKIVDFCNKQTQHHPPIKEP